MDILSPIASQAAVIFETWREGKHKTAMWLFSDVEPAQRAAVGAKVMLRAALRFPPTGKRNIEILSKLMSDIEMATPLPRKRPPEWAAELVPVNGRFRDETVRGNEMSGEN